jgi:hypothetical protein
VPGRALTKLGATRISPDSEGLDQHEWAEKRG